VDSSSKIILDLYNEAIKIRKSCPEQRQIFQYWLDHNSDPVYQAMAFDTETTGVTLGIPSWFHIGENTDIRVNYPTVVGISLGIPYKDRIALLWGRYDTSLYKEMTQLLEEKGQKVGHSAKYDVRTLFTNGVKVAPTVNCTLTQARIYWDRMRKFALDELCEVICPQLSGWKDDLVPIFKKIKTSYTKAGYPKNYVNYSFIPDGILGKYSMKDVFVTLMLNIRLRPAIDAEYAELYERERQVMLVVAEMERRGIIFDTKRAALETSRCLARKAVVLKKTQRIAGPEFKPTAKKVLTQLYAMGVTEEQLTNRKGAISTGKDVLQALPMKVNNKKIIRFTETVLEYRSLGTLVGSFLKPLRIRAMYSNGTVYYTINPTDTRTSRMAGRDPNLQNIPRIDTGVIEYNPVRACFLVRNGFINYFHDYSQMEIAMFAYIAGDKKILRAYANGEDIHSYMTTLLTGLTPDMGEEFKAARQRIKSVNFGVIYGMGLNGLAQTMKTTLSKATEFYEMYMDRFTTIKSCQEQCVADLEDHGYVEDPFGRHYHIDTKQAHKAVNYRVQGGCAQAVKIAFLKIRDYLKTLNRPAHILVPIHDEFLSEIRSRDLKNDLEFVETLKNNMEEIPQLMKHNFRFRVDIKYSTDNWGNKKDYYETIKN